MTGQKTFYNIGPTFQREDDWDNKQARQPACPPAARLPVWMERDDDDEKSKFLIKQFREFRRALPWSMELFSWRRCKVI